MGGDNELKCKGRCPSNGEGCLLKIGDDFLLFNIAKPNKTCWYHVQYTPLQWGCWVEGWNICDPGWKGQDNVSGKKCHNKNPRDM